MHATTAVERLIHLLLFASAAGALGTVGLAVVERLVSDGGPATIKVRYAALAAGVFVALFAVERLYHAVA